MLTGRPAGRASVGTPTWPRHQLEATHGRSGRWRIFSKAVMRYPKSPAPGWPAPGDTARRLDNSQCSGVSERREVLIANLSMFFSLGAAVIQELSQTSNIRHRSRHSNKRWARSRRSAQLGQALSAGDLRTASNCWALPARVLSDEGAMAVSHADEIEKSFAHAAEWYHSQGITSTKPEIERVDMLSEQLASVDVRWPSFDPSGKETSSERSHYIVQLGKDGQARVRVALTRKS